MGGHCLISSDSISLLIVPTMLGDLLLCFSSILVSCNGGDTPVGLALDAVICSAQQPDKAQVLSLSVVLITGPCSLAFPDSNQLSRKFSFGPLH